MFEFRCVKCNRSEKKDEQIVPKQWATITTFRDESGKYYLCSPCKTLVLVYVTKEME